MQDVLMTLVCVAVVVVYAVLCRRKDRQANKEHQVAAAVITAMSFESHTQELTTVRPNPLLMRKQASCSTTGSETTDSSSRSV